MHAAALLVLVASAVAVVLGMEVPDNLQGNLAPLPSKLRFRQIRDESDAAGNCVSPSKKVFNCGEHGLCQKGQCLCDVGFGGVNCTKRLEPCNGHGSWKNETGCTCKDGYTGAACQVAPCPKGCSGNGLCWHDARGHPQCICFHGAFGADCSGTGCPSACSGHGQCLEVAAGDGDETVATCRCDVGWTGQDCGKKGCPGCVHGDCKDGACVCYDGWTDVDCSKRVCPGNCTDAKHGRCEDGLCMCEVGWAGPDCSLPGSRCPNECNGRGRCTENGCVCDLLYGGADCLLECMHDCSYRGRCEHGVCHCPGGWEGDWCQSVSCKDNCNGNGFCNNGTCLCHPLHSGPTCAIKECPNQCSDHGKCVDGICLCDRPPFPAGDASWVFGYFGADCSQLMCPNNCTGPLRGHCDGATGQCSCLPGFVGDDCSKDACYDTCSGHGTCPDKKTGCVCQQGWRGTQCELKYCEDNCNVAKGQGQCVNETCRCSPGFTGHDCSQIQCPTALPADSELRFVPVPTPAEHAVPPGADKDPDPLACTRNGYCVGGRCACHPGWKGKACHIKSCLNECNDRGICLLNGKCDCKDGWGGDDCSVAPMAKRSTCPNDCSGHGICRNGTCYCEHGKFFGEDCSRMRIPCHDGCAINGLCDPSTGICHCNTGRAGSDCSKQVCFPSATCSGNGRCVESDGVYGVCQCAEGWAGPACKDRVCDDPCSGHGTCLNNKCWCNQGYGGDKCSEELCPNGCSKHGVCQSTGCQCDPAFRGRDCSIQTVFCPHNCSGAGDCYIERDSTQPLAVRAYCKCQPGFVGLGCERALCPGGCSEASRAGHCGAPGHCACNEGFFGLHCEQRVCPNACSGHGTCDGLRCTCFGNWGGEACDTLLKCAEGCEKNGVCNGTTCVCDPGFRGASCSEKWCPDRCSGHGNCDERNGKCVCSPGFAGDDCAVLKDRAMCAAHCQFSCGSKFQAHPALGAAQSKTQSKEQCVEECVFNLCSAPISAAPAAAGAGAGANAQNAPAQRPVPPASATLERLDQLKQSGNYLKPVAGDTPRDHTQDPIWW